MRLGVVVVLGGGNDEREQTLNQLLIRKWMVLMGMNIIVIAATQHVFLTSPPTSGRFDRKFLSVAQM